MEITGDWSDLCSGLGLSLVVTRRWCCSALGRCEATEPEAARWRLPVLAPSLRRGPSVAPPPPRSSEPRPAWCRFCTEL